MNDTTKKALEAIARQHAEKSYQQVTKADLYEALKYARHVAKCALASDA